MWWYVLVLLPVAVVLWLLYEWMEHSLIQYNSTIVECRTLPKTEELRLCLISDLHNNKKDLAAVTRKVQEFCPEFIVLSGDMVDKHKQKNLHAEQFLAALSNLNIPVYYSQGNHELSMAENFPQSWKDFVNALPKQVRYLDNEAVIPEAKKWLCISGLSLPKVFYKKGRLYQKKEELPEFVIPKGCFHIMLAHNPEYAPLYEKYHADFIVSGHLHGGLLRLPLVGGLVSPRLRLPKGCDAGLVELPDGKQMFVSRGLGSHTIPLRFFNRVEVNFLVLKGTKE